MSEVAYCFDLDGTLTSTEILPCIAAELGVSEEVATLTRITMEGLITFDESLRLRCALLGQVAIERVHTVIDDIALNSTLAEFIREHMEQSFVVTGNLDLWVGPLVRRLGCRAFWSNAVLNDARLQLINILDKGSAVAAVRAMGFERVVAIGDGSNDVPMLSTSDVGVAYGGVHSPTAAAIGASTYVVHDEGALCSLLKML